MSQYAIDLESEVVGTLLLQPDLLAECDLTPEHFSQSTCSRIYRAICDLTEHGEPVDAVTVAESLGGDWLKHTATMASNAITANFAWKVGKVREAHQKRQARAIGESLLSGGDPDQAVKDLMALTVSRKTFDHDISAVLAAAIDKQDEFNEGIRGIPTGLSKLDESLGGLHASDLVVVGARPAVGKTAFMLSLAVKCGVPTGIISGEQPIDQVGFRLLALKGRVSVHRMRTGKMEGDDWTRNTAAVATLRDHRLWVNDQPGIDIDSVARQARKWVMRHGIKLLLVDYIQKIKAKGQDRRNEVAAVVVALKDLARELQIPVVALAQVKREVESRNNKRPMVSDLKEAGEIEQEADQIITLYRDEVYDEDTLNKGVAELIVGKNRHGPTGTIRCAWVGEYMAFENLERER